jgi:hypothetical protein
MLLDVEPILVLVCACVVPARLLAKNIDIQVRSGKEKGVPGKKHTHDLAIAKIPSESVRGPA